MDRFSVRAAYDSVELFIFIVNETLAAEPTFACDGTQFTRLLKNRLLNLTSGVTKITDDGIEEQNLDIYGFSEQANMMKV